MNIFRLLFIAFLSLYSTAALADERPNIVIIYADDMGYGDMTCQNPDSKIPTPHLDQLAQDGVRFTDGHSSSGVCTPSRYALLTGRYHWRSFHGICAGLTGKDNSKLELERLTLPEMLQESGYRTACVGKWHLGWNWPVVIKPHAQGKDAQYEYRPEDIDWSLPIPAGPCDHGFDYYFGDDVIGWAPFCWIENDRAKEVPTLFVDRWKTGAKNHRGPMCESWDRYKVLPKLGEQCADWIRQQQAGEPFFMYFALSSPHGPIVPTEEFVGKSGGDDHCDFMYQTDHVIGEVLQAIDEAGFRDNSIVVFSSDNGPEGERATHERFKTYQHDSAGGLRGVKRDIWEGGHRVPFIVRWPGVMEPGRVSPALINQIDLMATFADLVGYDLPDDAAEDSFNQLATWKDNTDQTTVRTSMVHNTREGDHYAVRQGDWVLIDHKTGLGTRKGSKEAPEWIRERYGDAAELPRGGLYNLKKDLGQLDNQIDAFPEKAAELRVLLKNIREGNRTAPRKS